MHTVFVTKCNKFIVLILEHNLLGFKLPESKQYIKTQEGVEGGRLIQDALL